MTFDDIWQQLVCKQSSLENDDAEVVFKVANFRVLLKQVYEQGRKSAPSVTPGGDSFKNIFGSGLFG